MMIYGTGAMRRGSDGLISLGGLYGINSAIKDIKKAEQAERLRASVSNDEIDLHFYKSNDNRYAWRLNCEDGSSYGIHLEDYETREKYSEALQKAKRAGERPTGAFGRSESKTTETKDTVSSPVEGVCFCRVSLLSNGRTEYFRTGDQTIRLGELVVIPDEESTTTGVVVSVANCFPGDFPQPLEDTKEIIGRA